MNVSGCSVNVTSNCTDSKNNYGYSNMDLADKVMLSAASSIFVLAVIGNVLVILTLVQNTRMRTVTNVFLLNLAISDLLLAVFCMPFTVIPLLLKNFIFGPVICVAIRYAQGVSVGASCFTLVAISLERYFAICRPLHSRQWQTLSHAYRVIAICWMLALFVVLPIAFVTEHVSIGNGRSICRENWENVDLERAFTVFLDVVLLLIPLCLMAGSYSRIMATLCVGMNADRSDSYYSGQNGTPRRSLIVSLQGYDSTRTFNENFSNNGHCSTRLSSLRGSMQDNTFLSKKGLSPCNSVDSTPRRKTDKTRFIRQTNAEKCRESKIRVIRMLFVMVIEFFVCWSPLYAVHTWRSFHTESLLDNVNGIANLFIFMLSYMSSCCNPITYCFMNTRFRQAFVCAIRKCFCCGQPSGGYLYKYSTQRITFHDCQKLDETEMSSSEKSK